jgi:tetratricopeptide (TPR) repeat protein
MNNSFFLKSVRSGRRIGIVTFLRRMMKSTSRKFAWKKVTFPMILPLFLLPGTAPGQEAYENQPGFRIEIEYPDGMQADEPEEDYLQGVLFYGRCEYEEALDHLNRSIEAHPEVLDAFLLRGICRLHLNAVKAAREDFDHYVERDRRNGESANVIGKLYYVFGLLDDAEVFFRRALEQNERCAAAHSNLGSILIEKDCLKEAKGCLVQAVELDPCLAEAHVNLGIYYFMTEDFQAAEKSFLAAADLNQKDGLFDPIVYANLGDLYFVTRKLEPCIHAYTVALKLKPELSSIRTRLGMALNLEGEKELAREQFEIAISTGGEPPEAHVELAALLLKEGRIYEAISEYRAAIRLSGEKDRDSIVALAGILAGMEHHEEALRLYRMAYELGDRSPAVLAGLSRISELCGFEKDAVQFYRLLAGGDAENPVVLLETARRCTESRLAGIQDPERALSITHLLAKESEGNHPGVLDLMASAYARMGNFERAAELENLAIQALPEGNPMIQTMRARLEQYRLKE